MDFVGSGVGGSLGIDIDSGIVGGGGGSSSSHSLFAANTITSHQHATASSSSAAAAALAAAAQFAAGGGNGGMGAENNPILYNEPNRTSAIDDIRSGVIYIFIITIFLCFFLILPGIRNDKFPTFLCITSSLIVTSIILISLFGTTWHVAEAPISAAYKAFSRDRIQGDLNVKIGLQSVNITLRAQKYYILHETRGPMIMFNSPSLSSSLLTSSAQKQQQQQQQQQQPQSQQQLTQDQNQGEASKFIRTPTTEAQSEDVAADSELDAEEVFADRSSRVVRSSGRSNNSSLSNADHIDVIQRTAKQQAIRQARDTSSSMSVGGQKYTIKRVDVDINYNERFYWIGPNQMAHEHQKALERGLPYPILTVVEYLSQDDAGFNWSRQYRSAGYYTYIILWLSLCICALMFFLHCAAPRYGIYTMQVLGALMLFANLTYATLVPRGEQKLVIPFEGQSLTFRFGWSFWLVLLGGCLSLLVGTTIVIIDYIFPNFILTTVLDVDYDSHHRYYKHKRKGAVVRHNALNLERPARPPFMADNQSDASSQSNSSSASRNSALSLEFSSNKQQDADARAATRFDHEAKSTSSDTLPTTDQARHRFGGRAGLSSQISDGNNRKKIVTPLSALFTNGDKLAADEKVDAFVEQPAKKPAAAAAAAADSESSSQQEHSSVVEIYEEESSSVNKSDTLAVVAESQAQLAGANSSHKNNNLKSRDHQHQQVRPKRDQHQQHQHQQSKSNTIDRYSHNVRL